MSRIGKKPITIPAGTEVSVRGGAVAVKGPKGALERMFLPNVAIAVEEGEVRLTPASRGKYARALWGTYASHIANMVAGVNEPFSKQLVIEGVGFKAEVKDGALVMQLGFSHPVVMRIPEGISVLAEKNILTISGVDIEAVGAFAAKVRLQKKPEPYKGKGIRYRDEVVRRKQGKRAAGAA